MADSSRVKDENQRKSAETLAPERSHPSKLVNPGDVVFTLLGFAGLYLLLGMLFVIQVLKEINRGPAASH